MEWSINLSRYFSESLTGLEAIGWDLTEQDKAESSCNFLLRFLLWVPAVSVTGCVFSITSVSGTCHNKVNNVSFRAWNWKEKKDRFCSQRLLWSKDLRREDVHNTGSGGTKNKRGGSEVCVLGGAGGAAMTAMTAESSISPLAHPVPRSLTSHCRTPVSYTHLTLPTRSTV